MRDRAKSAGRALEILAAVGAAPAGATYGQLLDDLDLPKSSLHEVLAVLLEHRFIEIDAESRRYLLAVRAWEVGVRYLAQHDLATEAKPFMKAVVQALNETVQLAVLDGLDNVYIAKVDCSHPVRLQSDVGKRLPAHATGLGKVLLASLPPEDLESRLTTPALPAFTTRTITDRDALLLHLDRVRKAGFALDDQEYTPGLRCVAVPVYDHRRRVIAALSASVPMMRVDMSPLWRALSLVAEASLRISERIGAASEDTALRGLAGHVQAKAALAQAELNADQASIGSASIVAPPVLPAMPAIRP